MQYWIITDSYAAPTCDLTDEQFERFRDLSCNNIPGEFNEKDEQIHGEGENRMVLCVEYRSDWTKSEAEKIHENAINGGDVPFYTSYVKIIPNSIVDKEAPHEFTQKKSAYRNRPSTMRQGTTFIEQFLHLAKEIEDDDQDIKNNLLTNTSGLSADALHIVEHIKRLNGYNEPMSLAALKPPSEENGQWFRGEKAEEKFNDILILEKAKEIRSDPQSKKTDAEIIDTIQKLHGKQLLPKSALRTRREDVRRIQDEETGFWYSKDTEGVFFRYKKQNELPEYFILCKRDNRFPKGYPQLVDSAYDSLPSEAKLLKNIKK